MAGDVIDVVAGAMTLEGDTHNKERKAALTRRPDACVKSSPVSQWLPLTGLRQLGMFNDSFW